MPYSKPSLTIDAQVELLASRGMRIPDRDRARHYLGHISYYRLRAYWLPYEIPPTPGSADHVFRPGTSFDDIIETYNFDRELRLLLLDAIERVEVSLRSLWVNHMSQSYGAFAHTNRALFDDEQVWEEGDQVLATEYQRSRETFAVHFRTRYPDLDRPPIWVAAELLPFGHLSRSIKNLNSPKDRQAIANAFGIDETVLASFVHHLSIVRNHCAHHGRVWNRHFSFRMRIPWKKPAGIAASFNRDAEKQIYNTLTMLAFLLKTISPAASWSDRVQELLRGIPVIAPGDMGFPSGWEKTAIWAPAST